MDGGANSVQPFKYCGKELDRMHGLNWYDHGARMSAPALGRWHVVDPMCEKFYDVSPYTLCGNDPVNKVNLDGNKPSGHEATLMSEAVYRDKETYQDCIRNLKKTG